MNRINILEERSIPKLLIKLCVPSIVVMIVMVIYNMADIFFIGQTGDPYQVAAIALSGPIYATVQGIGTLIGSGSIIGISIALGKGEHGKVKAMTAFSFWLSILLGIIVFIVISIVMVPLIELMGGSQQTAAFAGDYIQRLSFGYPVMIGTTALSNIVRADGSAKVTMTGNLLGTLTNIILDPIFILGFGMGVKGAAIATVVGVSTNFIFLIIYVLRKKGHISLNMRDIKWRSETTIKLLSYGIPMASSTVLMSFSSMFLNRALINYGDLVIAGAGVSGRIGMLIGMTIIGITMGMQPAISYSYGARDFVRMKKILLATWLTTALVGSILSLVIILLRTNMIMFFINNEEVIAYGKRFLLASLLTGPVIGLYELSTIYLQATGKVVPATVTALLRKGLVLLPMIFTLRALFGLNGLIYANMATDVIAIFIGIAMAYRSFRRDVVTKESLVFINDC